MTIYLLMLGLAALISYFCTWGARKIALRFKVYAPIRSRDVHSDLVPRLGGLGIFAGFALTLLVASQTYFVKEIFKDTIAPWGILAGAVVIMIVGVIDDIFDARWWVKLLGQIAGATIVAAWGVRMSVLPFIPGPLPIESRVVQVLLTVFLIVVTMNAINFIDGLDGLAAGVAVIAGIAFFVCSYWVRRNALLPDYSDLATLLMALMVGACLGFLPHNFHPAKIFMGDSGSMLIGLLMASAGMSATGQIFSGLYDRANGLPTVMPIILPIAILMVPMLDLGLAVVRRTAAKRTPWSADRGHLHHKLIDLGYSHRHAVSMMYLWTFVLAFGGIAFAFLPWQLVIVIDTLAVLLLGAFTALPYFRGRMAHR
jgi:UDP-GlcNAc:undecaprenyl-phosphate GlcNAc-1-phosphate transferase